jgi:O-antigen ligase
MFLMLASVAMAVVFPQYGVHQLDDVAADFHVGEWRGVFNHKNLLGGAAAVSILSFLIVGRFVVASLGLRLMGIVAAIACLIFAHSAGSLVALCVVLAIYYLTRAVRVSGNILLLMLFVAVVLATTTFFFFGEDFTAVVGRDATLTGRTAIWPVVLHAILQKPLLGFGYVAASIDFIRPILAVDSHNGYLDVLLGTGTVGLAVLLFCILSVIRRGIDRVKLSAGPERDCFMLLVSFPIFGLFHSFVEVASMAGVQQDVLGALNFLSLTAIPIYLQQRLGNYRSVMSAANRGSALLGSRS